MKHERLSLLIIFLIFIVFFTGIGFLAGKEYRPFIEGVPLHLERLQEVYSKLNENYLFKEKIERNKLEYGAIKGFVSALGDPYTYFMDPQETKSFLETINGSFEGIGAEVGLNPKGQVIIVAPLEGTPAKKAGLEPSDIVLQIDDKITSGMTLDEAITHIRGNRGTTVTLLIQREILPQPIKISIVRDVITIPTLAWKLLEDGKIAYVQLYNFNEKAGKAFDEVAQNILTSGATELILDLRGNPGGLLQEAIHIGGWFIEKNNIIVSERFGSGNVKHYVSEGNAKLKDFPLAVLIDRGSASASEILAGALRVTNKATLIGEKSFGKGTVQVLDDFSDESALRLTVSQWLLPSGTSINQEGLTPDITQTRSGPNEKSDAQLEKAIEVLKSES